MQKKKEKGPWSVSPVYIRTADNERTVKSDETGEKLGRGLLLWSGLSDALALRADAAAESYVTMLYIIGHAAIPAPRCC